MGRYLVEALAKRINERADQLLNCDHDSAMIVLSLALEDISDAILALAEKQKVG